MRRGSFLVLPVWRPKCLPHLDGHLFPHSGKFCCDSLKKCVLCLWNDIFPLLCLSLIDLVFQSFSPGYLLNIFSFLLCDCPRLLSGLQIRNSMLVLIHLLLRLPVTFFKFPVFAFGVSDSFSFSVSFVGFFFRSYMVFTVLFSCLLVFLIKNLFRLLISLLIVLILSSLSGISFTSLFLYTITIGLVIFRKVLLF